MNLADFLALPVLYTEPTPVSFLTFNYFLPELTNGSMFNSKTLETLQQTLENKHGYMPIEIQMYLAKSANPNSFFPVNQWKAGAVWYKGVACMVVRNVLYYPNDGLPARFIIDGPTHKSMIYDIFSNLREDFLAKAGPDGRTEIIENNVIDLSRNSFFPNRLFGDMNIDHPQCLVEPDVWNMTLLQQAIDNMEASAFYDTQYYNTPLTPD